MEQKYHCYTNQGSWLFYAADDIDAMRKALYICWRDGEEFQYITDDHSPRRTICLCEIEGNSVRTI